MPSFPATKTIKTGAKCDESHLTPTIDCSYFLHTLVSKDGLNA